MTFFQNIIFLRIASLDSERQKGHSTSHGITCLHETIIDNLEQKKVCAALFIDLKSAFDTIDPLILIKKLDHYGIRGTASDLLLSYLSNRKQFIQCETILSEMLSVLCGVPQGSVLGPLLFLVYINDMVRCIDLNSILFADDAVLSHGDTSVKRLESKINNEISKLHQWFLANKLTLNLSKTKYILFSRTKSQKNKLKKFKVNINNYCIKQISEMKYLGVILDSKLNWHEHIQYVSTKLARAAGVMYKFRNKVPQNVLMLLYHSIVASYLRYGIATWGSAKPSAITKLQNLQNKIVRHIAYPQQSDNILDHYTSLSILNIKELHFLEVAKFIFRSSKNTLPVSFDEYFRNINHSHYTRSKSTSDLALPRPRIDLGKGSIKISGVKIWNELPARQVLKALPTLILLLML